MAVFAAATDALASFGLAGCLAVAFLCALVVWRLR